MNDEQRQAKRERDRRSSASYRARKKAEAAERARAAADGEPGPMRQAVDASLAAMKWLADSDAAAIAQARAVAKLIDVAARTGDLRTELRAHPILSKVLADLGGTPRVRLQLELRSRKLAVAESDGAPAKAPNVTPIASKRPAKRQR